MPYLFLKKASKSHSLNCSNSRSHYQDDSTGNQYHFPAVPGAHLRGIISTATARRGGVVFSLSRGRATLGVFYIFQVRDSERVGERRSRGGVPLRWAGGSLRGTHLSIVSLLVWFEGELYTYKWETVTKGTSFRPIHATNTCNHYEKRHSRRQNMGQRRGNDGGLETQ